MGANIMKREVTCQEVLIQLPQIFWQPQRGRVQSACQGAIPATAGRICRRTRRIPPANAYKRKGECQRIPARAPAAFRWGYTASSVVRARQRRKPPPFPIQLTPSIADTSAPDTFEVVPLLDEAGSLLNVPSGATDLRRPSKAFRVPRS